MRRQAAVWIAVVLLGGFIVLAGALEAQSPSTRADVNADPLPQGALARLGSVRLRHDTYITSQAASPNGKWLASGGGRTVRVWEAATGKQVFMFPHVASQRSMTPNVLVFSPDNKFLAALGSVSQGVVTVWDLQNGQQRYQVMLPQREDNVGGGRFGQPEDIPLLAFVGNNASVLVKNYGDRVVRQFDLESGQELRIFQDPGNLLTAVSCSPNGATLAAGSDSRQVILWDVATGKELRRLPHDYSLVSIAFSPDNGTLATLDLDLSPMLWDVKTGTQLQVLPARTRAVGIAFTHDGQSLLVARQPDEVLTWNLKTQKENRQRLPKSWTLTSLSWMTTPTTKDDTGRERLLLGTAGRRGTSSKLRMIELTRDGLQSPAFDGYENGGVFAFYLSALKQWATVGTAGDDTVRLWDAQGRVTRSIPLPIADPILNTFAVAPDGRRFSLGCRDGRIYLADAVTGKLEREIRAFQKACHDSTITADGRFLIANDQRTAKVFDLATGQEVKSYDFHTFDSMRAYFSADGSRLAAMIYNQDEENPTIRVLEARTGAVLTELRVTSQQTTYFFSGDGRSLLFLSSRGGRNGPVNVMEVATGKSRMQVELTAPFQYAGNHARISPDGRWLVAAASGPDPEQYAALAWRLGTRTEPAVLQGHRGLLVSVNFASDARQLLTVSYDSTLLAWDMERFGKSATAPRRDVKELQKLWDELKHPDGFAALTAIHQLADQTQAAPWLKDLLLKHVVIPEPDMVRELIDKLDSAKFSERQKATDELTRWGNAVAPVLRDALSGDVSAEVKKRVQQILEKAHEAGGLGGLTVQTIRGIEALEIMGSPAALEALSQLARRTDALGNEARWAELRLKQRLQ